MIQHRMQQNSPEIKCTTLKVFYVYIFPYNFFKNEKIIVSGQIEYAEL
jgi:hypothetical protein